MTTAPTPSELLALRAGAMQQIRLREKFGPEGLDLELDPAIVIRLLDRIQDLEGKVGRFQGVPMALIEAINAATGSNDWQGDHSPTELLEPACSAITGLQTEREEEIESANNWRRLALQFDGHRMQALAHLRTLLASPEAHRAVASEFLAAPPLSGAAVLAQRLAELEARKPLPLSDEQIDDLHGEANRGFDIGHKEYTKAFRDAERAHGITGGSS